MPWHAPAGMGVFQNITLHRPTNSAESQTKLGVSFGVRTCELFLCFVVIVRVRVIILTSLFSLFYVTGEFHRFLHRGRAWFRLFWYAKIAPFNSLCPRFEYVFYSSARTNQNQSKLRSFSPYSARSRAPYAVYRHLPRKLWYNVYCAYTA